jgi:hypothetical protein
MAEPMERQQAEIERVAAEDDCREARAYGAALVPAFSAHTWEEIEPLVRDGSAIRHARVGEARYDWRLSWPAVREGWMTAGGAFAAPTPETDQGRSQRPTSWSQVRRRLARTCSTHSGNPRVR